MTATPSISNAAAPCRRGQEAHARVRAVLPPPGAGAAQRLCQLWPARPDAAPGRSGSRASIARDSATAFDPGAATRSRWTWSASRVAPAPCAAIRGGEIRYTALNFASTYTASRLDAARSHESTQVLRPTRCPRPGWCCWAMPRLRWPRRTGTPCAVSLSSPSACWPRRRVNPQRWPSAISTGLISDGIRAELLPIALHNIERASRDRALLRSISAWAACSSPGAISADSPRPCCTAPRRPRCCITLVTAYERGTPLIAVSASATALGARMIAEGDSVAPCAMAAPRTRAFPASSSSAASA
jgi:hypothetical protein